MVGVVSGQQGIPRAECLFCLLVNCSFRDLVLVLAATFVGLGLSKSHRRGNKISHEILQCFGRFTSSIFGIHPIFLISICLSFWLIFALFSLFFP